MKKYIRLFIIAMAVLFIMPNVNAREFKINDTIFSIEGVRINLYGINFENNSLSVEEMKKYVSKQPSKTYDVDISNISYHPKYKKIGNSHPKDAGNPDFKEGQFVDIDFNFDKEFLSNYLRNDIENTSDKFGYLFEVVLVIKPTNIPDNIKTFGLLESSIRADAAELVEVEGYVGARTLEKNKTFEYVLSGGYLSDNNMEYATKFINDSGSSQNEFSTLGGNENFSSISFTEFLDFRDAEDNNVFGLTILDLEDFNDFIEYESGLYGEITDSGDVEEVTYDAIPVPNTALDFSKLIYIVGYLLLIGGAYLLIRFNIKKRTN